MDDLQLKRKMFYYFLNVKFLKIQKIFNNYDYQLIHIVSCNHTNVDNPKEKRI